MKQTTEPSFPREFSFVFDRSGDPLIHSSMGHATLRDWTLAYAGWIYGLSSPAEKWKDLNSAQIAERVLDLYLRQGDSLFPQILGEFTVCIFSNKETICFRSLLSPEQLYYSGDCASNRLARVASRLRKLEIEDEYFLRYFVQSRPLQYRSRQTPIRGISRLLPGHCLRWIDGKMQEQKAIDARRYVNPHDPRQSPESVGEELHELFMEIIDDRIHAAKDRRIYCELSGGLDSSYIASVVGGLRHGIPAFMFLDPKIPSHRFNEDCAREVVNRYGLEFRTFLPENTPSVNLSDPLPYSDEPAAFFWQGAALYQTVPSFVARDAVIFSGVGADQLFIRNPIAIPWLLKMGKLRQFSSTLEDFSRHKQRSKTNLLLQCILSLFSQQSVRALQTRFSVFSTEDIDPEFGLTHQPISWLRWPGSPKQQNELRRELEREEVREREEIFGAEASIRADPAYCMSVHNAIGPHLEADGIRHLTPYYDQRLIDFVNSRVSWHLIHSWRVPYKNLLREAQRGVVPDKVRARKKNEFDFGGYLLKVYEDNRVFLLQLLSRSEFLDLPLFAKDKILPAFEKQIFGVNSASCQRITDLIMMLLWWREFKSEVACLV